MRGGAREGAGRKPVPTGKPTLIKWSLRVHEHEKELVKAFLKDLRKNKDGAK